MWECLDVDVVFEWLRECMGVTVSSRSLISEAPRSLRSEASLDNQ